MVVDHLKNDEYKFINNVVPTGVKKNFWHEFFLVFFVTTVVKTKNSTCNKFGKFCLSQILFFIYVLSLVI